MIVIVGESGAGKTTLAQMLVKARPEYERVVTCTTRPMRANEIDGVDYVFTTEEAFDRAIQDGLFIEHAKYRGWQYGTCKFSCVDNSVVVLTPAGLRALVRSGIDVVSIYIDVDRRSRLIKMLSRGDDVDEACRRSCSDVGQFDGISHEVNLVISNHEYQKSPELVLEEALKYINEVIEC